MEYSGPHWGMQEREVPDKGERPDRWCEQNSQAPEHEKDKQVRKDKGDVHSSFDPGKWLTGKGWRLQGKETGPCDRTQPDRLSIRLHGEVTTEALEDVHLATCIQLPKAELGYGQNERLQGHVGAWRRGRVSHLRRDQ